MKKAFWITGAMVGLGVAGFATLTARPRAAFAHHTGHESRTAAQCGSLPGDASATGRPPPSNMRYWCTQCVQAGGNHYHPDCPAGSRCSPDNGQNQCGGGAF